MKNKIIKKKTSYLLINASIQNFLYIYKYLRKITTYSLILTKEKHKNKTIPNKLIHKKQNKERWN